jgi:hypothetical protein
LVKNIFIKKLLTIKTRVCPAIIFAVNRIPILNALIEYENNSIGINNNSKNKGDDGTNKLKNFESLLISP